MCLRSYSHDNGVAFTPERVHSMSIYNYLFILKILEQDFVFVQIIACDFIPVFNPYKILVWCKFHSGLCKVKINFVF